LLGISPSETLRILKEAYGKESMKNTHVCGWHKRFRDDRASVSTIRAVGDAECVVRYECILEGRTVNKETRRNLPLPHK
jgi:hypothetical protein